MISRSCGNESLWNICTRMWIPVRLSASAAPFFLASAPANRSRQRIDSAWTFTSSPGFSLMLEGISYLIGAEVPAVFVNIMRGGPGLGNIAPAQADIKLACRGLGHGNTHAIVLAPATPQEMLAYVKAQGNKLTLAHAGLGAVSQLCGMLFQKSVGVDLTTVPYQGTAPAMNALLGGQVDLLCDQTTQTLQHIKAGNVKLYGVTTRERIRSLPETPTLEESGLKGFEVKVWHGIYAPKGTPKEALDKFGAALKAALRDPTVATRLSELGAVVASDDKLTPTGLQTWLQQEIQRYGPIIKAAGQFAD